MANEKRELTEVRAEIIKLDEAIVELLDARGNVSQRIGKVKLQFGLNLVDRVWEQVVYKHATSHPRILSKSPNTLNMLSIFA